ncbi:glycosyltransferase family 4 protein [Marinobacter orientalis]|uniref:Glycosyltransferase family 4 protein n=1 Tax=Marinobacter orientalis TaxID=1928859 RepID=A0A7Y0RFF1_9GAMM|nr:glycosyltransferase family 4 protein [Marinobacter orientalis]NMT65222.1 glycosyltransferase family 4 protein [Marinobacter orientalis]
MARIAMLVWNEFVNDARVLKEAQTLAEAGHQVVVHALHTPGKTLESEELEPGVRVERVVRSPFWSFRKGGVQASASGAPAQPVASPPSTGHQLFRLSTRSITHLRLWWRLVRSRAGVIHAHDVNTLPTAWLASKWLGIPLVYDAHEISTDREGYKAFRKWVGWIEKTIMPKVAASITTTDLRAKFFARAYHVPRPLVLQNRPRRVPLLESNRLREHLQLKEPWPLVVYQGGLQRGRGLDRLVEAAARLRGAYVVFVGGGNIEGQLRGRVREYGLEQRVFFIPTVSLDELPHYTASADIGVQPIENTCLNHFTTDSNKLFEYVAVGLPVVASALPEIARVVKGHDLGILTPAGDVEALAEALQRLVDDPELRARYSASARRAAAKLNWEAQESALVDLYRRILSPD